MQPLAFSFPDRIPFFGAIAVEFDPFHFFLKSFSEDRVTIAVPIHSPHSMFFREFDVINLHLVFQKEKAFFIHGRVDNPQKTQDQKEVLYDIVLVEPMPLDPPLYLQLQPDSDLLLHLRSDSRSLILESIKSMLLLKKGVGVYLSHLSIYFSRVIGYEMSNYKEFSEFLFKDIFIKIKGKTAALLKLYESLRQTESQTLSSHLDFSQLAYYAEPEVNLDLYNIAFPNEIHLPYMVAMKELEGQLFGHFNNLVLLDHVVIKSNRDLFERFHRLEQRLNRV